MEDSWLEQQIHSTVKSLRSFPIPREPGSSQAYRRPKRGRQWGHRSHVLASYSQYFELVKQNRGNILLRCEQKGCPNVFHELSARVTATCGFECTLVAVHQQLAQTGPIRNRTHANPRTLI